MWDSGHPDNDKAITLCRTACKFLDACEPGENEEVEGVIRAGRNYASKDGSASKYKGVTWHSRYRRWYAHIKVGGRALHLGTYLDEDDAARAYDRAARPLGRRLNFPNGAAA